MSRPVIIYLVLIVAAAVGVVVIERRRASDAVTAGITASARAKDAGYREGQAYGPGGGNPQSVVNAQTGKIDVVWTGLSQNAPSNNSSGMPTARQAVANAVPSQWDLPSGLNRDYFAL